MEANSTDLHTKYQKLATEYSKLRAQVSVLKKGVVDEQSKTVELKDMVKEKDQAIRKYEQEIDSLSFRNQQMSKRVVVLQDELDGVHHKNKKTKNKSGDQSLAVSVANNVIGEELQSKIEENVKLHKQVFEVEQQHQKVVDELADRLESVQKESAKYQQVLGSIQDQNAAVVERLQQDKARLEIRLQAHEKDLKVSRLRSEECEEQLKSIQHDLGRQLDSASSVLQERLPFNDTSRADFNVLNIPTHDRKHQARLHELVHQVAGLIRDLVAGLSNFHTYTEQRFQVYPEDAGDCQRPKHLNAKFAYYLRENASYLRPLEQSFLGFQSSLKDDSFVTLETAVNLADFGEKFNRYVAYLHKLLPYHLLSIEDECRLSSCTASLEVKNMQFHGSLSRMMAAFNKLNTYVSILCVQSDPTRSHRPSSQKHLLYLLVKSLQDLHAVMKETSMHYNSKVSLEHQLPTATQKLKTTDEFVLSSMISLVTCTGKLSSVMSEKLDLIVKDVGFWPQGTGLTRTMAAATPTKVSPAVNRFRHRASNYVSNLQQSPSDSVPYQEALTNREILLCSTESRESLARQLATSQEKISKLEQAKEHWMLEFQLLQIKHEKELKKLQKLEEQVRGGCDALSTVSSGSSNDEVLPPVSALDHGSNSPGSISMLGKLEILGPRPPQSESREAEIKSYFTHRIRDLVAQMQVADSKALTYHSELCTMQKRLALAEQSRTKVTDQLVVTNTSIDQLREELATTTKNYESQLSMMSEHLANMNDKLTAQKDEIDSLKFTISTMGSKKNKGK